VLGGGGGYPHATDISQEDQGNKFIIPNRGSNL